jgi:hypothetical protein
MVTEHNVMHPIKQKIPIEVTELGITMDDNDVHP